MIKWKWFIFVSCVICQLNPIFVTFELSCEATEPDRLGCYLHLEDQVKPPCHKDKQCMKGPWLYLATYYTSLRANVSRHDSWAQNGLKSSHLICAPRKEQGAHPSTSKTEVRTCASVWLFFSKNKIKLTVFPKRSNFYISECSQNLFGIPG